MQEARRRARGAAKKRRSLAAGSGQKLGGAPISRGADIRNVIVNAITRRNNITKGCVSDSIQKSRILEEVRRNGFRTKAEEDDANERAISQAYMELVQEEQREKYGKDYVEPTSDHPAGSHEDEAGPSESNEVPPLENKSIPPPEENSMPPPPIIVHNKPPAKLGLPSGAYHKPAAPDDSWTCDICTLNNLGNFLCCDACGTERSSAPTFGYAHLEDTQPPLSRPQGTGATSKPEPKYPKSSIAEEKKLRSRSSRNSLRNYAAWGEAESKKPLGWLCQRCGTFMETEWWSCASCGTVKSIS